MPGPYFTKQMAVDAGGKAAIERGVEHVIRDMDGSVWERRSHGVDARGAESA